MTWDDDDNVTIHHRDEGSDTDFINKNSEIQANGGLLGDSRILVRFIALNAGKGSGLRLFLGGGIGIPSKNTLTSSPLIKDVEHTCDEEKVKSAELIRKQCKNCPKCGALTYKISGCPQMWCTSCHTAWNWNTGRIETKIIHNPHYFEYLKIH